MNTQNTETIERAPVVAIMGHIDHGKSTILSYIRKNASELNEAGGITQHISAYEVKHTDEEGKIHSITFLDTPGHEAFCGIRQRGAKVADIAILVVSAEDGVKPQTIEALKSIKSTNTPYIVAINKIDKPEASIERTKQSLAENEIYVEGYGGDIPVVPVSGKTGEGISELLDMIVLVASLSELRGNPKTLGKGIIIESNCDIRKGISSVCVIKDGYIKKGMYIASGPCSAPIRIMENYVGKQISEASFSSPIKVIGWDCLPEVGNSFEIFETREEALDYVNKEKERNKVNCPKYSEQQCENYLPIIVKTDTGGSLEAVLYEIQKLGNEKIRAQIISCGIGDISENDVRLANGSKKAVIIGFNTKVDSLARHLAERTEVEIKIFDIIYKMSEWLSDLLILKTPKILVEESVGQARVIKIFSKIKDRQILGGSVEKGLISVGSNIKIKRRDIEIGQGKIRGLEQQKKKVDEIGENKEFGAMIEAKIEIAPGDRLESFIVVEK